MHDSSYEKMSLFVGRYLDDVRGQPLEILDFGSQVVGDQVRSYRTLLDDPSWTYRGLDIEAGNNVDVVVADPYDWSEIESDSVDLVVSGQAFEHVEYFWASMFEIVRVLKPGGLATIIAPAGGFEHRFPLDCWRFYRDGFDALARYVDCEVLESFSDWDNLPWEDSILVARKPAEPSLRTRRRSSLQRALLADEPSLATIESAWSAPAESDEPTSILAAATPGAMTAELESARAERQRMAAAAAEAAAAQAVELDALREQVRAFEARPGPLAQAYGTARAKIAALAGDRGRAAYKRLRGRS